MCFLVNVVPYKAVYEALNRKSSRNEVEGKPCLFFARLAREQLHITPRITESKWKGIYTGELGYDGPLYDRFLYITDDMLGPSPMHIMYSSYVYDRFCIWQTNFPGPIKSVISKFTCSTTYQNKEPQQYRMISFKGKITWNSYFKCFFSLHFYFFKTFHF